MLQKACIKIVAHAIDTYLFFLIIQLSLLQNKRLLWSLFFSANVTTLMEELVLVWMTNHVNLITLSSNHCCCRVFLTGRMWGSPLPHSWNLIFINSIYSSWNLAYLKRGWNLIGQTSLFHVKITVSVTKSLHQDCGSCYWHLPIFSYHTTFSASK